ncbi:MAG: DnaJ domain-containing protein, partial [Chloroflexi bacterium]|nr:DnaJ domain-containing protein [Chloroflexota bacterium]
MDTEFEYYTILGITPQATPDEIQDAFASLRGKIPQNEQDKPTNPKYAQLVTAFEVLSDPDRRTTYDSLLVETKSSEFIKIQANSSRERVLVSDAEQMVYLLLDILPPTQKSKQR